MISLTGKKRVPDLAAASNSVKPERRTSVTLQQSVSRTRGEEGGEQKHRNIASLRGGRSDRWCVSVDAEQDGCFEPGPG